MTALILSVVLSSAYACPEEGATATATTSSAAHTATATAAGEKKAGCQMPSAEATTAVLPADGTHAWLAVAGMHCGSCADSVHVALMGVEGVKGARVDLAGGKVEVAFDAKKTNLDKLGAAVASSGKFTAEIARN